MLADDDQAVQARVDLIQQAQQEINAAYYAADSGRVSAAVLLVLRDAARRGVRVRLLVDGMFGRIPEAIEEHLLSEGVEIRQYHPLQGARPIWLNRRMHEKLLVVDACRMIVGSRNLQDHHFGLDCVNFVDRDAYVSGGSACCAREYFLMLWESRDVRPVRLGGFRPLYFSLLKQKPGECGCFAHAWADCSPGDAPGLLEAAAGTLVAQGTVRFDTGYDWSAGLPEDAAVRFLYDRCLDKHAGSIDGEMVDLIDAARQCLVIETPYPVFPAATKRAILAARSRGVAVRLLTNSLASTDLVITYADYQNHKRRLLDAGVDLWELAGPDHLHAKSMVVDGWIAMVGSANLDVRGAVADLETAVIACGPEPAAALAASIEQHLGLAYRIGPDGRPADGGPRHPGADPEKVRKLQWQRPLVPFIRRLL